MAQDLFPLDGGGRLGGDIVDDAVNAFDFIDDPAGNAVQDFVGQLVPVGGHAVETLNGAHGDDVFVGPVVAHNADGLDRQQHGEVLPDIEVIFHFQNFLADAQIGKLEQFDAFPGDLAKNAYGETGAGEGLAVDDVARQSQFSPDSAHFVFEEFAERFNQFKIQIGRQASDVVVAFDRRGRTADRRNGFDDIRVKRTLRQVFYLADFARFVDENIDEDFSDDLTFLFGVGDPGQCVEKDVL